MERLHCPACRWPPPRHLRVRDRCPRCSTPLVHRQRCAWCLAWADGGSCEECGAELLDTRDFGVARMMVAGGVDRFALAERVKALGRGPFGAESARFDAEWGALGPRLAEARWLCDQLVLGGHLDEVERALLARVPLGRTALAEWSGPARLDVAALADAPHVAPLADLARVHAGEADAGAHARVAHRAVSDPGLLGAEAALATTRAAAIHHHSPRWDRRGFEAARAALGRARTWPGAEGWAAVGLALWGEAPDAEALARALQHPDRDLRLAAALALDHRAALAKLLDDGAPHRRERARRALAELGDEAALHELRRGDLDARRQVLRWLRTPLGPAHVAAVLGVVRDDDEARDEALRALMRVRFDALDEAAQRQIAAGLAEASRLPTRALAEVVEWACEPPGYGSPPAAGLTRAPLVHALGARLAEVDEDTAAALLRDARLALERWLYAARSADAARVLDAWVREDALADRALDLCLELHGRLNGYDRAPDPRAALLALGVLDRGGAAEAARVGDALARHRGVSGREAIVEALWARFRAEPARRADVARAGRALRYELREHRRCVESTGALSLQDPPRFFAIMAGADPEDGPALLDEAVDAIGEDDDALSPLVDAVAAYARPRLTARPCTVLRVVASLAAAIANRYRAEVRPARQAAADRLRAAWTTLAPLARDPAPVEESEGRFAHVLEHVELELRLIDEREAAVREAAEEEARRAAERAERQREVDRRAAERADEEARRAEEEARRRAEAMAQYAAARARAAEALTWVPDVPSAGLDAEPLLADTPLPALRDFARVIKALSASIDVPALFDAAGLTPETWSRTAAAWAEVISSRPHVTARWAALLMATWGPPRGARGAHDGA